jgi:hypothetical protein
MQTRCVDFSQFKTTSGWHLENLEDAVRNKNRAAVFTGLDEIQ